MMVKPSQPETPYAAGPGWLVTFADLIALVLAFFVMMYAAQRVENGSWQAMIQSLSRSLKVEPSTLEIPAAPRNVELSNQPQAIDLAYLEALLNDVRASEPALADIVTHRLEDRLIIALPGDLLFQPGRVDPVSGAAQRIAVLANLLRNISNRVDVFGHTDPSPVPGQLFESNWELSLARAETIAAMMRAAGYPRRLGAFGLADTRFEDLAGISSRARKLQLSRRVDIVVRTVRERR
jgi:chemotaxis protein MotB